SHRARTVALRASALIGTQPSNPATGTAVVLPGDSHLAATAPQGLLEAQRDGLVQIGPTLRAIGLPARSAPLKHLGKQIAERRRRGAVDARRKIDPFESERGSLCRRAGAPSGGIVLAPPLGIAQRLIRLGDPLELCGRGAVAWVDVGMVPTGQTLV